MPTITIEDKICPHCGGNKWYIHTSKDGQTRQSCFNKTVERRKKFRASERGKQFEAQWAKSETAKRIKAKYHSKPETKELRNRLAREKHKRDRIRDVEKVREKSRVSGQRQRDNLAPNYMKRLFLKNTGITGVIIPDHIINIKVKQVCLERKKLQQQKMSVT